MLRVDVTSYLIQSCQSYIDLEHRDMPDRKVISAGGILFHPRVVSVFP